MAPTTATLTGLGFAVSTIDWIERAAVVSTAGMTPKVNAGCFDQTPGDSAEPAMHGTLYLAQIGSIASCTPLVYAPKMAFTPSSVTSRDVASAPVAGSLLQSCTDQLDVVLPVPDGQPALVVHRVGPELVSALGDLSTGRGCAGQLEHGTDLERVGRLFAGVAAARGEQARAGNHAAHHEAGPGEKESTVDVVGHDHSSRIAVAG